MRYSTADLRARSPRGHDAIRGSRTGGEAEAASRASWSLTLGSVGVVYGDIGTSPLYAFREAVTRPPDGGPITREVVLGVLSLILWALIIVVTVKYVLILLRADNNGEGGTLSLTALASRALGRRDDLRVHARASSAPRCSTATP